MKLRRRERSERRGREHRLGGTRDKEDRDGREERQGGLS